MDVCKQDDSLERVCANLLAFVSNQRNSSHNFVLQVGSFQFCFFFFVHQVQLDDRVVHTDRGLLIRSLNTSDVGIYICVAQEHTHFTHTLVRVTLQLVSHDQLDGKPKPNDDSIVELRHSVEPRQHYKEFLGVMSSPFNSLEEYCDLLWLEKRPSRVRGRGLGGGKWKYIQEMKKSRNRRHHRGRGGK